MSTYAVVHKSRQTGEVLDVLARGMWFMTADELAAQMQVQHPPREGVYVKAINENELTQGENA